MQIEEKNKVVVLMSTYNGEKYLEMQIESVLAQKEVNVYLLVRDDGSTDKTRDILRKYEKANKLEWYYGDNLKSARSFMDLIKKSPDALFYAFCDQDDYWLPNKLITAINYLNKAEETKPAIYYGKTTLVNEDLEEIDQNKEFREFITFGQAVVSSSATGCTMCFNKCLRDLINLYTPDFQIMHDGWLHKVCLAFNGNVFYDRKSYILYRQHGNNVIGGTSTPYKRFQRRIQTIKNNPYSRSRCIIEIIKGYGGVIPEENLAICNTVASYKNSFLGKVKLLSDNRIYSPNKRIDRAFRLAVILGIF